MDIKNGNLCKYKTKVVVVHTDSAWHWHQYAESANLVVAGVDYYTAKPSGRHSITNVNKTSDCNVLIVSLFY